ncbi:hypothetical protein BU23DRAFT_330932 [Bimuria novae-zelandiae CBS 107.79]|uniref:GmrSD restriction endonucleases N-terminal domain-containing protein n=1 Tax=Bimuria novae-zelandiae CBS 107.79 TaxID=1447943 RepID=A0A6A5UMW9_9PLEO|nr:hypothetical protein BU23DRAFT_330932 [Bimuria novae-zelandiae CBS 107.79]
MQERMEPKPEVADATGLLSYKPRPALATPGYHLRSMKDLISKSSLMAYEIDLNPEYQRDIVWTADRMSELINSLMENFYIPPIIFNRKPDGGSKFKLVCIDGKQRLSSVSNFVKGIIPCSDYRGEKWWFCDSSQKGKKNVLSPDAQKAFLENDFVTFEYTNLSRMQEEDMFGRVQMGVPLSAAEKLRAQSGPWQELAKMFVTDFPIIYALLKDPMRGKDFQHTLSCFSQIMEVKSPSGAKGNPAFKMGHNNIPKLLKKTDSVDDDIKSHLAGVWRRFQDIIELDSNTFTNADKYLNGVQTFAPVEMAAVTVLISVYFDEGRSDQTLLEDVRMLRRSLRENFPDLRMNEKVWKEIWNFIDNLHKFREATDGNTVDESVPPNVPEVRPTLPPAGAGAGAKKGRHAPKTKRPSQSEPKVPEVKATESRPRKRQRTGSPPSNSQEMPLRTTSSVNPQQHHTRRDYLNPVSDEEISSPHVSRAKAAPTSLCRAVRERPALSSHTANPATSNLPPRPASTPPSNTVNSGTPTLPPKPAFTPLEARPSGGSEHNSYRVPVAPMGLDSNAGRSRSIGGGTVLPYTPASIVASPVVEKAPSYFRETLRSIDSPSAPQVYRPPPLQPQKPASVLSSTTAMQPPSRPAQSAPTSPLKPQLQALPGPTTNSQADSRRKGASLPQFNNVIDLTEDETEEKRVYLLSAFQRTRNFHG